MLLYPSTGLQLGYSTTDALSQPVTQLCRTVLTFISCNQNGITGLLLFMSCICSDQLDVVVSSKTVGALRTRLRQLQYSVARREQLYLTAFVLDLWSKQ